MFLVRKLSLTTSFFFFLFSVALTGYAQTNSGGIIIFVTDDGTGLTIQALDRDDTSLVRTVISQETFASNHILDISRPIPSPDGSQIVFMAFLNSGDFEIFVYSFADNSFHNVSNNSEALDIDPSWHPDDNALIFSSDRDASSFNIWQITLSETAQLTEVYRSACNDRDPKWSPDGTRLVLVRSPGFSNSEDDSCPASGNIWIRMEDDAEPVLVTSGTETDDSNPVWSPDGTKLAYTANLFDSNTEIFVVDLNLPIGSNIRNLTMTTDRNESNPSWSPEGNEIVYSSTSPDDTGAEDTTRTDIFKIDLSSQSVEALSSSINFEFSVRNPVWTSTINNCITLNNCDGLIATSVTSGANRIGQAGACQHVVQAGENFFRIGLRYGYRMPELEPFNTHLGNIRRIHPGNIINIPDCSRESLE